MKIDYLIFFLLLISLNIFFVSFYNLYSRYFNIVDRPDKIRKLHKSETKVLGGTIILLNIILFFIYFYLFDNNYLISIFNEKKDFFVFLISLILIYFVGIYDDKLNMPALNKTVMLILIITLSLYLNKNIILDINLSFYRDISILKFSLFFSIFAYIVFMNAFNMLDGINLQTGIYSLFILSYLIFKGLDLVFGITIILGILSYLKLNFENKIFLGDNGALILSYIFAYFFIDLYNEKKIVFSDEILLILLIPGLEIIRLSIKRIISNKSILLPDRRHIHHLILVDKKFYLSVTIIQIILVFPYLLSLMIKNNAYSICISTLLYISIIFYFSKNERK